MRTIRLFLLAVALSSGAAADDTRGEDKSPVPDRVQFNRDVRPILSENCYACHGPDPKTREANLRLDTKEGISAPLDEGHIAVTPGNLEKSELWKRVSAAGKKQMPPAKSGKKLTARDASVLKRWIEQGAEWQGHWAFIPPGKSAPPAAKNAAWVRNPVDAFILARIEKEGLRPSVEADPVTLLRRLSFDLTGLPPSVEEVDDLLKDPVTGYEKAVDRLLASPHYGERMALMWLDLVRFADSRGYHSDNPRNVGSYRDYVIEAFNQNLPFDRIAAAERETREHLASDVSERQGPAFHAASAAWAFHGAIAAATHNRLLVTIYELVNAARDEAEWGDLKDRSMTIENSKIYVAEHAAILKALRKRDAEQAEQAVLAHCKTVRKHMLGE